MRNPVQVHIWGLQSSLEIEQFSEWFRYTLKEKQNFEDYSGEKCIFFKCKIEDYTFKNEIEDYTFVQQFTCENGY